MLQAQGKRLIFCPGAKCLAYTNFEVLPPHFLQVLSLFSTAPVSPPVSLHWAFLTPSFMASAIEVLMTLSMADQRVALVNPGPRG